MGAIIASATGNDPRGILGIKTPKVDPAAYEAPGADDLRTRINAILDSYMTKNGYAQYIPRDKRPYEYLSPEEQAQVKERKAGQGLANNVDPEKPEPAKPDAAAQARDPELVLQENKDPMESPDVAPRYNTAAFAAALKAKREGVDPTELALTAPRALAQQNQAAQAQALADVQNFIRTGSLRKQIAGGRPY